MLTTIDNPFNPFDDWDSWFAWDTTSGYHTLAFLARIANVSEEMSDTDYDLVVEQAIDEIVRENVSGVHVKISREVELQT